jgi:Fe-S-cluster containining protein
MLRRLPRKTNVEHKHRLIDFYNFMTITKYNSKEVGLTSLVPEAFKLSDRIARNGVEREAKLGSKVSCAKGCAACCSWLVRVSIPEALYLYERILECETQRRDQILGRFHKAREILKENGLAEKINRDLIRKPGDVFYDHGLHLLSRRYLALRITCPFLEEKTCLIYSWRPIICRQYYVTSPASQCTDPFKKNVRRVSLDFNVADMLAGVAADLLYQPMRMIALPLAVNWAAAHKHLAKLQWPQRQLFAGFLKR